VAIRYTTLIVSLIMMMFITIIGLGSVFGNGRDSGSLLFVAVIDVYYGVILFYWKKYYDPAIFTKANRILLICSLIPLVLFGIMLFMMSRIQC